MRKASEKGLAYIKEWDKQNAYRYGIKLSRSADADIIEWLQQQKNKNGAIKQAIRNEISRLKPSKN